MSQSFRKVFGPFMRHPQDIMIHRPRGTRDFLPDESYRRRAVRTAMEAVIERWGYQEISTPTFENLELFTLKSGPGVLEEIYSFKDKGDRDMALRPELTAPVMRMYVNELQNSQKPLRLYYFGNCFRYERPQKGRFREFWQLGSELIGGRSADSEAEVIAMASAVLKEVGIRGDLHLGYLGIIRMMMHKLPLEVRPSIMRMIDKKEHVLLAEALDRLDASHLGLIELIGLKGRAALDHAEQIVSDLQLIPDQELQNSADNAGPVSPSEASSGDRSSARSGRVVAAEQSLADFRETVDLLDAYGVDAVIDFEIVRGLDYYTGSVFEIYAEGLGAQSQICGGGTYRLAGLFGGSEVSSTGFGMGFDRIMEIVDGEWRRPPPIFIAFTPQVRSDALKSAISLRRSFPVVVDVMGRGLGAQLKAASAAGARWVVIIGQKEADLGVLTLRDMLSGSQEQLSMKDLEDRLKEPSSSDVSVA
jgi:histidyl-tRNA synthetase